MVGSVGSAARHYFDFLWNLFCQSPVPRGSPDWQEPGPSSRRTSSATAFKCLRHLGPPAPPHSSPDTFRQGRGLGAAKAPRLRTRQEKRLGRAWASPASWKMPTMAASWMASLHPCGNSETEASPPQEGRWRRLLQTPIDVGQGHRQLQALPHLPKRERERERESE